MARIGKSLLVSFGLALAGALPASAHPHVWVTSKSTVIYSDGGIGAVEQSWTFDEFYSSMAVQGLDTNNDGQYSREELAELTKVNMEGLKQFDYFTVGERGQAKLEFGEPVNASLDFTGGILTLHFTLPLKKPAGPKEFRFTTFDPTNLVAFELAKDDGVRLAGGPKGCQVSVKDGEQAVNPDGTAAAQNQTLAGAFAEQFQGAMIYTMKWASIQCDNS
jgi:ABC-type uncharacterized transport system substrate-binding protein